MFGTLGGQEIILILVIALIVFGPRRLPDIGKSMGKMLAEFRKASQDFKRTIEDEVEAEKIRASIESVRPSSEPEASPSPTTPIAGSTPRSEAEAPGDPPIGPGTPDDPAIGPGTPAVPETSVSRDAAPSAPEPVEPK